MAKQTNLYRGYVPTKNKACIMTFKGKKPSDLLTKEQAVKLSEYAGILADNVVLVDVDDYEQSEILMHIVEDTQLACRVYKTTRGKHFLFLNNSTLDTCKTHATLSIGLTADIKLGCRNSYSVMKFDGKERPIIYDIEPGEEYDTVPAWLIPVKTNVDFIGMGSGDGRNQALFNHILTLQSAGLSTDEIKDCIHLMNKYIFKTPLPSSELETILREDAFKKPAFYKGNQFLFDVFAKFLISSHSIVKMSGQILSYDGTVYVPGTRKIENLMINHIPSLSKAKRGEVLAYIDVCISENTKPASADYIAFNNGIYDIKTGELLPFSSEYVITNKIDYDYVPDANAPIVDSMLNKLAVNDPDIRALLEEVVGYTFYRRNELRRSFVLLGDKHNGKSTYLDMITHLLGEKNTSALDLKELGDRFKTAELFGKLANIGDDIGDEFIGNPAIFKKVVSGDRVNAEKKGQDPFDFNNYSKMLFSCNALPRIKDKSGAVLDRLVIVPFNASFTKDDPDFDPYIKYKLRSDECMERLIQLGLNGLKRVLDNNGFTKSDKVESELKEYEKTNNPILQFLEDITLDDIVNQPTKSIYRKYSEFCLANNYQPMSNIEFSKRIKKEYPVDISLKRIKNERVRIFVKL